MQKATEELIKKMQGDKNFAEQILTCKENDEAIVLAKEQGIDLTLENIVEVNEALQFSNRMEEGELTEEELEQVAGGTLSAALTVSLALTTAGVLSAVLSSLSAAGVTLTVIRNID